MSNHSSSSNSSSSNVCHSHFRNYIICVLYYNQIRMKERITAPFPVLLVVLATRRTPNGASKSDVMKNLRLSQCRTLMSTDQYLVLYI